jgi:hypothetical protein
MVAITVAVMETRRRSQEKAAEKERAKAKARENAKAVRLARAKGVPQTSKRGALGKAGPGNCPAGPRWITRGIRLASGERLTRTIAVPTDAGTSWGATLNAAGTGVDVVKITPERDKRKRQRLELQRWIQRADRTGAQSKIHVFMQSKEPRMERPADHSRGDTGPALARRIELAEGDIGGDNHGVARALARRAAVRSSYEILGLLAPTDAGRQVDRRLEAKRWHRLPCVQDLGAQQEHHQKPRMDRISEEERIQTQEKIAEMEVKGVLEEVPWDAPTKAWHPKHRCWMHEILNDSFTQAKKDTTKLRLLTNLKRSGGNERM